MRQIALKIYRYLSLKVTTKGALVGGFLQLTVQL